MKRRISPSASSPSRTRRQHAGDYEIIVVDGGSKDATCEIARKYADKVFTQTSKKVGGARNDGIMAATGDDHRDHGCGLHPSPDLDRTYPSGF